MTKERPILFSAPMIRAILDGSKTQTRRIVKPQPTWDGEWFSWYPKSKYGACCGNNIDTAFFMRSSCPYGKPGDRLWVRETFFPVPQSHGGGWHYKATEADDFMPTMPWKPSIHMPRAASRITLEITGVRVERLQDISEEDAKAEGCQPLVWVKDGTADLIDWPLKSVERPYGNDYALLWESINGPGSWSANPWVWAVEFKRIYANSERVAA